MSGDVVFALWFFLPAALANMAAVIAGKMPALSKYNAPIDGGRRFRGKPLLGKNKTWRGLVAGIVVGTLTLWVQQLTIAHTPWAGGQAVAISYTELPVLVLGPLFAIGVLGGDAIKSFFKRQLGAAPGKAWPVIDQIGEILGAIVVTLPFVVFSFGVYVGVIIGWVLIDLGVSTIGYLIGWKERPV